jgi:hypothetical protein
MASAIVPQQLLEYLFESQPLLGLMQYFQLLLSLRLMFLVSAPVCLVDPAAYSVTARNLTSDPLDLTELLSYRRRVELSTWPFTPLVSSLPEAISRAKPSLTLKDQQSQVASNGEDQESVLRTVSALNGSYTAKSFYVRRRSTVPRHHWLCTTIIASNPSQAQTRKCRLQFQPSSIELAEQAVGRVFAMTAIVILVDGGGCLGDVLSIDV